MSVHNSILKTVSMLPGVIMILGGIYCTFVFVPKVFANPDDSMSLVVLGSSLVAVLFGVFVLWTSYRAFHMVHPDEEEG